MILLKAHFYEFNGIDVSKKKPRHYYITRKVDHFNIIALLRKSFNHFLYPRFPELGVMGPAGAPRS